MKFNIQKLEIISTIGIVENNTKKIEIIFQMKH